MKEANLNSLRTSHYPPLPALIDYADEMGIYVEDEGPFCWAGVADDLRLTPRIMQLNAELLARDRNHPSVFMWSICNESSFGYGFQRSAEWVKAADPTRPRGGSYQNSMDIDIRHNPISVRLIEEVDQDGQKAAALGRIARHLPGRFRTIMPISISIPAFATITSSR